MPYLCFKNEQSEIHMANDILRKSKQIERMLEISASLG